MIVRKAARWLDLVTAIAVGCLISTTVLTCAAAELPQLWGRLRPGPYSVGYRVSFEPDYGRIDLAHPNPKVHDRAFRPVMMAVWFPAVSFNGPRITYEKYLKFSRPDDYFSGRVSDFGMNALANVVARRSYPSLHLDVRRRLDQILKTAAYAQENAQPATGPFPVVIYHPGAGGSFEENSVLFEFLASHGYVVISSAYQMSTEHVSNDMGGVERSIADMRFLLNEAGKLPFADTSRAAAVGHSAGGQHLLQWIGATDCPLRAIAVLDSTLEYTPESFEGHRPVRHALAEQRPPRKAVLLIASAERHPNFRTFDRYLRQADRYEASVRGLTHDDYLTHGIMRAFTGVPRPTKIDEETLQQGYQAVCQTILSFLTASLKADRTGIDGMTLNDAMDGRVITVRRIQRKE